MFIGHFALGFAAKRSVPQVSLGALLGAALFLDLLWPVFLLTGVESVVVVPGYTVVTPLDLHDYPYSHSLLMALAWSLLFGGAYALLRRDRRGALMLGALVFSHWLLDLVAHRPDMPLYPGSETVWGFGLWNSLFGTLLVESALLSAGVALYARATRSTSRRGSVAFWSFAGVLVLLYAAAIFGPPPPNTNSVIGGGFGLLLLIAWGFWLDRTRELSPAR